MKNILIICHDIPSKTVGATLPIYHLIKNLEKKYNLHLISFDSGNYSINDLENDLTRYDAIEIPQYHTIKDQLLYTLKNMITVDNLHAHSFLNYYYHKNMTQLIKNSVNNIDLIITDMPMAFYAKNINLPKIVYAFDAVSNYNYKMYQKATSITSKIYWYLNYKKINHYEQVYNNFNNCIVVNKKDKAILEKDIHTEINVVPNGVDTEYFKNDDTNEENKLVFLGDMSTPPNNDAIKYFTEEIYPQILKKYDINLYIVGRNPSEYIKQLHDDKHIIVTGSVDDVRGYLKKGSIFITPMISGTGIKNKILEAMSMQLPVVSTTTGISGINATNNKEYLLADTEEEFEEKILLLLENKKLQYKIGNNARKYVEKNYSWNTTTEKIEEIINKIIKE